MIEEYVKKESQCTIARTDAIWIILVLVATSLATTPFFSPIHGYIIALIVYVSFIGMLLATDRFTIVYHWAILPLLVLIWTIFTLTTVLDPNVASISRLGAFTLITGTNLFVIPAVINRTVFHDSIARLAGIIVLVGLPAVLLESYMVVGIQIGSARGVHEFLGMVMHIPVSIYNNPNTLSVFAVVGAVAAGAKYNRSRSSLAAGLVGLNMVGVVLAGGRSALLALVVAGTLYAVYRVLGRTAVAVLVGIGVLTTIVGLMMAFQLIPGPSAIANVNLSGRRSLWTAAYGAITDRPVLGWGLGNDEMLLENYMKSQANGTHNSYLRMFLISGALGGLAYLMLSAIVVIIGLQNIRSETLFTFLLLISFFIIQLFGGSTIFGLSLLSTLGALFVGYVQSSSPRSKRVKLKTQQLFSDLVTSRITRFRK